MSLISVEKKYLESLYYQQMGSVLKKNVNGLGGK